MAAGAPGCKRMNLSDHLRFHEPRSRAGLFCDLATASWAVWHHRSALESESQQPSGAEAAAAGSGVGARLGIRTHGRSQSRFGALLIAILTAVCFQLAAPEDDWALFITVALQGAAFLLSLRIARLSSRVRRIILVAVLLALLAAAVLLLGPGEIGSAIPRSLALMFVALTPIAVISGLLRQMRVDQAVTLQTMYAALCLYLLVALAFAFVYGIVDDVGDVFFADGRMGSAANFLYFSFVTMTTTGYGDFTPATHLGRSLAVGEALIGQVYLVTVVALIVSHLGQRRQPADRR